MQGSTNQSNEEPTYRAEPLIGTFPPEFTAAFEAAEDEILRSRLEEMTTQTLALIKAKEMIQGTLILHSHVILQLQESVSRLSDEIATIKGNK